MELYAFLRGAMAWTILLATLWPLNIPLAALAYKIRSGPRPMTMERAELWTRSTFGTLVVALASLAAIAVDYVLVELAEFPAGPIHLAVFMGYLAIATWIFFVFFALDDLLGALGLFVIYIYLPVLVLYLLNLMVGFWDPSTSWPGN